MMVENSSYMYVTGPDVVKTVTNEIVNHENLGGPWVHNEKSGVGHFVMPNDRAALAQIRELLSFMPSNNVEDAPRKASDDPVDRLCEDLDTIVPADPKKPYDMAKVIGTVLDDGHFVEVHAHYAKNILVGFGRLGGRSVGVIGNQPMSLSGTLDIDASLKAARFVRFCDCFNIPLVTFVDVPGFLPGTVQEFGGIIKHGAKLLYAYCEATVPKLTVITRKAYGGAYDVMSSKHIRGDVNYAWPCAEIAVMGAAGAVEIIYRNEIKAADDPIATKDEFVKSYEERFSNPFEAAARGYIDDIFEPRHTRQRLCHALTFLESKRDKNPPKKHGNIPL